MQNQALAFHQGSGLGLAICRGIIEQHDGRITVNSTVGEGATGSFTLPASRAVDLAYSDP